MNEEATYNKLNARRDFIKRHVGKPGSILEIGALNAPVFSGNANVKYADRLTTEELAAQYPHKANIKRVDYVLTRPAFGALIPETFQLAIANHVIQQVPDLINWFDQLGSVVVPGGWAFLAVPDKRYTSDIVRPLTTLADLIDCAHRELTAPSVGQIFSHLYLHHKVATKDLWEGKRVDAARPRMEVAKAVRTALAMSEGYHSVHCHVFTDDSFSHLMEDLYQAALVDWVVHAREKPQRGSNEFLVMLRRSR